MRRQTALICFFPHACSSSNHRVRSIPPFLIPPCKSHTIPECFPTPSHKECCPSGQGPALCSALESHPWGLVVLGLTQPMGLMLSWDCRGGTGQGILYLPCPPYFLLVFSKVGFVLKVWTHQAGRSEKHKNLPISPQMQITCFHELTKLTKWVFIGDSPYSLLTIMKTFVSFINCFCDFVFLCFFSDKNVKKHRFQIKSL